MLISLSRLIAVVENRSNLSLVRRIQTQSLSHFTCHVTGRFSAQIIIVKSNLNLTANSYKTAIYSSPCLPNLRDCARLCLPSLVVAVLAGPYLRPCLFVWKYKVLFNLFVFIVFYFNNPHTLRQNYANNKIFFSFPYNKTN